MDETGLLTELRGAVEALSEGVAIFNAEDTLVFKNERFIEMNPDLCDVLSPGLLWSVFLAEAQRRGCGDGLNLLDDYLMGEFEGPRSVDATRAGQRIVQLTIQPTTSGGFVLTQSDVTEARGARAARTDALEMIGRFFEASPVSLLVYNLDSDRFVQWTPAWEEQFGMPKNLRDVWTDPADRADYLTELLARHRVDDFEARLKRGDGTSFPARIYARLIEYNGTRLSVASSVDMTQLYAQRDELDRQREASHQTEKLTALGELLAGVAHELNNPLSVVVGQALMLREEFDDPDKSRRIDKISTSAERCAKIVKTFLAMARQRPIELRSASLNSVIETAIDVAAYGLRSAGAQITLDLANDLPSILADEDQIAQVFVNLIVNAEHALEGRGTDGRVEIRTWFDAERSRIVASIEDNGPGISSAIRARIFEPFFTTKGVGKGTGVGLALCHRIVSSHDGQLELSGGGHGGARFTVSLPLAPDGPEASTGVPQAKSPSGRTALIVEDEEDIADLLAEMLKKIGIAASIASTAEHGLKLIEENHEFDLIISDLKMPGMGGRGMFDVLRGRSSALCERMGFITGDGMGREANEIRESSGRPLLEKPVEPQELYALVDQLLQTDHVRGNQ